MTEIGLGVLLVIGLLTRPAAFVAFLYLGSLWISEWGTSWIWELLVPVLATLGVAIGRARPRWLQEWEPASSRNRAAAMGKRASRVWPQQTPLTWLCSLMATTAIAPLN